jgi:hypothetical protein
MSNETEIPDEPGNRSPARKVFERLLKLLRDTPEGLLGKGPHADHRHAPHSRKTSLNHTLTVIILCAISGVLGMLRVAGMTHIAYQAVAHLFVGILIGGAIWSLPPLRRWCLWLAVGLSVLEVCAALKTVTQ